jgi:hypothetical protein
MPTVVQGALFREGKILLVKQHNRSKWTLPGGKPTEGEPLVECLHKKIGKKLGGIALENERHHSDVLCFDPQVGFWKAKLYLADIKSNGTAVVPSGEVESLAWVSPAEVNNYALTSITRRIIEVLVAEGRFK